MGCASAVGKTRRGTDDWQDNWRLGRDFETLWPKRSATVPIQFMLQIPLMPAKCYWLSQNRHSAGQSSKASPCCDHSFSDTDPSHRLPLFHTFVNAVRGIEVVRDSTSRRSGASGAVAPPEIHFSMALDWPLAFTRYAKALAGCAIRKYVTFVFSTTRKNMGEREHDQPTGVYGLPGQD